MYRIGFVNSNRPTNLQSKLYLILMNIEFESRRKPQQGFLKDVTDVKLC